jgi:MerR family transcriptional regulator, copper efflux regulator
VAMQIGELSKQTGLSKDTIRFYEKIGLITPNTKQAGTRLYKEYPPETIDRLTTICHGKGLGFRLSEIKELLDVWQNGGMSIKEQIEIIDRKVKEIAEKKRQLEAIETYLVNKLSKLNEEM